MRRLCAAILGAGLALVACKTSREPAPKNAATPAGATLPVTTTSPSTPTPTPTPTSTTTLVDLSDTWAPYVLQDETPGAGDGKPNKYRETFVALANETIEDDAGDDVTEGQGNYLELFGIPPSLSVLRKRFLDEIARPCWADVDYGALARLEGNGIDYQNNAVGEKRLADTKAADRELAALLRKHKVADPAALPPEYASFAARTRRLDAIRDALIAAQKRLLCERLMPQKKIPRPGVYDWSTHIGVSRFERKHMIFGWGHLTDDTIAALGKTPLELAHEALVRAIRERVVAAAGILEDGSVKERRDLVTEFTRAALVALDVDTPEKLAAFYERHKEFGDLKVPIALPPLPDEYSKPMKFDVVIDRGDVWYELPFRPDGTEIEQRREHMPSLTFSIVQDGKKTPLCRWRTTIGSWRSEMKDGVEYYKYKNSDVGPRVWRNIVAGPVWIPPPGTPYRSMLVKKKVKVPVGKRHFKWELQTLLNTDEMGPGYASAYGLAMAPHVQPVRRNGQVVEWFDNEIRTHGSVDYNSIIRRYSHGCHRLYNHLALRLFSFVLRHAAFTRLGQMPLGWKMAFDWEGVHYEHKLATRGYYYELADPIPVMVLEGNIKGDLKKPITEYVPKPGAAPAPAPLADSPAAPQP